MNYYTVLMPTLEASTTYYLTDGDGEVVTVLGSDINIMGKINRTPNKTYFESWVQADGVDKVYKVADIHVRYGNILQPVALRPDTLRLGFKTRHRSEFEIAVESDLSVCGCLWVCRKDYTPYRITSIEDNEMPLLEYKYYNGTFWSTTVQSENDVYDSESEVEFYCKCGAVSHKSMADIVVVGDEELDSINHMLTQLKQYMTDHHIIMVYDDCNGRTRVYRDNGLPDGYTTTIEDENNGHPYSMQVPVSALRATKEILKDRITDCWTLQLNYKTPETGSEEADDE